VSDLSLGQLVAVNLRLSQRIALSAGTGDKRREASVGLKVWLDKHAKGNCLCRDKAPPPLRIDYHGPGGPEQHPEDFIAGCPAPYHEPLLAEQVYAAIALEDLGGLAVYSGRAPADLPARCVEFYRLALGARDRFVAERDAAQARLLSR
jgi:hypothetical protein